MLLRRTTPLRFFVCSKLTSWLSPCNTCSIRGSQQSCFVWLSVFALLLQAHTSQAQFEQSTQQNTAGTESTRGYWRLKTQAATRSTLIQFFGATNQLLYEEILPEKWVKLNRKNQRQFDALLAQLLANQLLNSRIKTEPLPPTPIESTPSRVTVRSNTAQSSPSMEASYLVHAYVSQTGNLYLIVDNPDRLRYKISVIDQRNRALYEEFTNHNQYRRRLDLSALPDSAFQVIVLIDNKPFSYTLQRQDPRLAYRIQPGSVARKKTTIEQNQDDNKPSFEPVKIDL